jgi:prevent-host-death family protein
MRYSTQVRPVSYLKANAADVLADLTERREPVLITQNGQAKAVLVDVVSFEETQETLALLKILALGQREIEAGEAVDARAAIAAIKDRIAPLP